MTLRKYVLLTAFVVTSTIVCGCHTPAGGAPQGESAGAVAFADEATGPRAEMIVHGMACPFCATNLENSLRKVSAVNDVQIDLGTGRVLVTFADEQAPTEAELRKAVSDSGFTLHELHMP